MLKLSCIIAVVFASGLAIGEAIINWGNWQFAPLWIVDYLVAGWLLFGAWQAHQHRKLIPLCTGWAFTAGIFYMALFISLDPEMPAALRADTTMLALIGLLLGLAILGFALSAWSLRFEKLTDADNSDTFA